nr:aminoacyl-tRNA synthetase, class 1a, anticodon-binding [Tanacetum cinerariifolium]
MWWESTSTILAGSPSVPADVSPSVASAGVSNKGKSPMVKEDIPVKARKFKQIEEDILGKEATKRLHDEEQAQLDRQREKLAQVEANASLSKTLLGPMLEEPSSKWQKSTEAPIPSVPEVPQSSAVSSPLSSGIRKKSLTQKHLPKPKSTLQELNLDVDAQTFVKVVPNEDSDDEAPLVWSALVGWEVIPTPLGDINALYRIHQSTKHFTTLRQILHMVLFDSHKGGKGSCVWQHQHLWEIRSWRLYTLSNVHVLKTVSGEVLSMFADVSYPLSVKLMEKMLTYKLEIDTDVVGNDMNTAEQLIQFIKNQFTAAQVSFV